jgi:hypothetical protein
MAAPGWFVTTDYYEYDAFDRLIRKYRPFL